MQEIKQNPLAERRNQRQSNFELLRIAAMVMIVFHHFAIHGGFAYEGTERSIPRLWYHFIIMGGKIGVNLFVLISGYFLIQSTATGIDPGRVLKLWGTVAFYSAAIYGILFIRKFSVTHFLGCFLPITKRAWWFASTYFVLYLIHPSINRLLRALDKKSYQRLLLLTLLLWCVIPTILDEYFESNYLLWFMTLYALAGYMRLYGLNPAFVRYSGVLAGVFAVLTYASSVTAIVWETGRDPFAYYGMQKLPTLLVSVFLFLAFANLKISWNRWINLISSATFGVYLIHDNAFVRNLLWRVVFRNAQYQDSLLLIPYSVAVVCMVYIGCTLLDLLRQATVERMYMGIVSRNIEKISSGFGKMVSCIQSLIFGGCL